MLLVTLKPCNCLFFTHWKKALPFLELPIAISSKLWTEPLFLRSIILCSMFEVFVIFLENILRPERNQSFVYCLISFV